MPDNLETIQSVRRFNRFYTNILGLLNQHILASSYSLTEARVLFEINRREQCTANALATQLGIDRSYMSRIMKKLELSGIITRMQSTEDNRINFITLTEKGTKTITDLIKKSDEQIAVLLEPLTPAQQTDLIKAMRTIKDIISNSDIPVTVRQFTADDIAYVISRHCSLYETEYGLTNDFKRYVHSGVNHFVKPYDETRECLWIAEHKGKPAGSIAIVKVNAATAQLRYFLLEPEMRGRGLGDKLVSLAINFCREKGYKQVYLETISMLKTARHLYKKHGFTLTSTHKNSSWGKTVTEERWDLTL